MNFPNNFDVLNEGEQQIRATSRLLIQQSDKLVHHMTMIAEAMTSFNHFAINYSIASEDIITIRLIGIRLFNVVSAVVNQSLSGYYQNAALLLRDLLEVSFLINYFTSYPCNISEWRLCSESERSRKFSAFKIRTALDDRDAFTSRKRKAHYELLCSLGAHVSYQGFRLLRPSADLDAICGPFLSEQSLTAIVEEAAKIASAAGMSFNMLFEPKNVYDRDTKLNFLEVHASWAEDFLGGEFAQGHAQEVRDLVRRVRAKPFGPV